MVWKSIKMRLELGAARGSVQQQIFQFEKMSKDLEKDVEIFEKSLLLINKVDDQAILAILNWMESVKNIRNILGGFAISLMMIDLGLNPRKFGLPEKHPAIELIMRDCANQIKNNPNGMDLIKNLEGDLRHYSIAYPEYFSGENSLANIFNKRYWSPKLEILYFKSQSLEVRLKKILEAQRKKQMKLESLFSQYNTVCLNCMHGYHRRSSESHTCPKCGSTDIENRG